MLFVSRSADIKKEDKTNGDISQGGEHFASPKMAASEWRNQKNINITILVLICGVSKSFWGSFF